MSDVIWTPPDKPKPLTVHSLYYEVMKFCGCGNPQSVLEQLRDVLEWTDGGYDREWKEQDDGFRRLIGDNETTILMYKYWLCMHNWTEHGGNITYSWLTPEGDEVLALLKEKGCDPDEETP